MSIEGKDGWRRAARAHHVTMSGLLDAIGRALATGQLKLPAEVIEEAHRLDEENRERS